MLTCTVLQKVYLTIQVKNAFWILDLFTRQSPLDYRKLFASSQSGTECLLSPRAFCKRLASIQRGTECLLALSAIIFFHDGAVTFQG